MSFGGRTASYQKALGDAYQPTQSVQKNGKADSAMGPKLSADGSITVNRVSQLFSSNANNPNVLSPDQARAAEQARNQTVMQGRACLPTHTTACDGLTAGTPASLQKAQDMNRAMAPYLDATSKAFTAAAPAAGAVTGGPGFAAAAFGALLTKYLATEAAGNAGGLDGKAIGGGLDAGSTTAGMHPTQPVAGGIASVVLKGASYAADSPSFGTVAWDSAAAVVPAVATKAVPPHIAEPANLIATILMDVAKDSAVPVLDAWKSRPATPAQDANEPAAPRPSQSPVKSGASWSEPDI